MKIRILCKELSNGVKAELLVFDDGRIYSTVSEKFLSPSDNGRGYKSFSISRKHKGIHAEKRFYVHRIVAEAFLPEYAEHLEVNHKNFDKSDNRLENIEVCTRSENILHGLQQSKSLKITYSQFLEVLCLHHILKYSVKKISDSTGVNRYTVSNILRGKTKYYRDRYLNEGDKYHIKEFSIIYKERNKKTL